VFITSRHCLFLAVVICNKPWAWLPRSTRSSCWTLRLWILAFTSPPLLVGCIIIVRFVVCFTLHLHYPSNIIW
jgi:hypothetical protein